MSQAQIIQQVIKAKQLLADKANSAQRFQYLAEIERLKEMELEINLK